MPYKVVEDNIENALIYSYKLLNYRDRSRNELYERLIKKGFSEEISIKTVTHLEEKGFIDDKKLAMSLLRDASQRKYLGKMGLRSYLVNKGLSQDIIDNLQCEEYDEIEIAKRLIEKKMKNMKNLDKFKFKQRISGLLLRRGFSYDTIHNMLRTFKET
mgnify:CR=1 FL=1